MTTLNQNAMTLGGLAECRKVASEQRYRFELVYDEVGWCAFFVDADNHENVLYASGGFGMFEKLPDCLWSLIRDERERRNLR